MATSALLGVGVLVMGVVFALNIRRAAERFAESMRAFPRWVKWPMTDDPAGYRVLGAVFALAGVLLALTRPG